MKVARVLGKLRPILPGAVYRTLQLTNNTVRNDERFTSLYWQLVADGRMLLSIREVFNIYWYLTKAIQVDGDTAEFGVYQGGGAKLIASLKGNKPLHLFDTFEGMPEVDESIDTHRPGEFGDTSAKSVASYLAAFPNVVLHPGFFPKSTSGLAAETRFCFVHLDVDLYESTLSGLEFFYPRLNKNGYLISHDYSSISCPGVKKAFDEFFADKPEEVIRLWDTQCVVRKL